MTGSSVIIRHEQPPVTDAEWQIALQEYGQDRVNGHGHVMGLSNAGFPLEAGPSRPLVHHFHSNDSINDLSHQRRSSHQGHHLSRHDSDQGYRNHSSTHHAAGTPGSESPGVVVELEVEASSAPTLVGDEDPLLHRPPSASMRDTQNHQHGSEQRLNLLSGHRKRGSASPARGEEERSAESERKFLREEYEKKGWLPGPQPSRATRIRRTRAIRRLGLTEDTKGSEHHAVLSKYSELAKQIFGTDHAAVNIHYESGVSSFAPDPAKPPIVYPTVVTACAHSVIYSENVCTVVADFTKDWRYAKNPVIVQSGLKFYAAAPLRYLQSGRSSVDIGTLCIYDSRARDTFDAREQGILLNLANMLIYQLATLQSEITAQRSSSMYEASISFLRRSVAPDHHRTHHKSRKHHRLTHLKRESNSLNVIHSVIESSTLSETGRTASGTTVTTGTGISGSDQSLFSKGGKESTRERSMAVKTGPRDSKDAKRKAHLSDRALFTDAASTLRSILGADAVAMVEMDEYQLFIRKTSFSDNSSGSTKGKRSETKESIVSDFLQGRDWPKHIEPVVHWVPKGHEPGSQVLGIDAAPDAVFNFGRPGVEHTLGSFLKTYLTTRHVWWDHDDPEDDLAREIMALMPSGSQTTLATASMSYDGRVPFAIFASWNKPHAAFGDLSTTALPFVWILSGSIMASLAIRKMRALEQSQISYSNLQAHELRTPLHQILAITQLLRSAMSDLAEAPQDSSTLTTTQQIRDLLPFLDAIDTSGKTLHGIVDNILSFLDLKAKDSQVHPLTPGMLISPGGAPQSLEVMFEELILEACEEDKRWRRSNGQPASTIETIFEIIPPLLGEQVTEDPGYALRRALSKILSNAYKFIEGEGCVEIYVDDVPSLLPPEGYEDISSSKRISIKIADSGRGMDPTFVREKLGEPWAKEDLYATGSGLSIHLAYRIIDLLGGQMEIRSSPGAGCIVMLEVPVPRRAGHSSDAGSITAFEPTGTEDPAHLAVQPGDLNIGRKVHFAGFLPSGQPGTASLGILGECLERQYRKLGCEIVDIGQAQLVVVEGTVERDFNPEIFETTDTADYVFLVSEEHEADDRMVELARKLKKNVRRFRKPVTPSILRESLFPGHAQEFQSHTPTPEGIIMEDVNSPDQVDRHGRILELRRNQSKTVDEGNDDGKGKTRFDAEAMKRPANRHLGGSWKPRDVPVEEAVASLSLGDYFSSRKRIPYSRTPSGGSSVKDSGSSSMSTPAFQSDEMGSDSGTLGTRVQAVTERIKVLVVEDNLINRKILVKILSSNLPIEIVEAEDGIVALEAFKTFESPVIVLLDINMPRMDGYQACMEMRAVEKMEPQRGRSKIIAVTALASDAERRRGLVESGMDDWLIKPCGKTAITAAVEKAREELMNTT